MPNSVRYEWDVETWIEYHDGLDDVLEHNHAERVADLLDCLHAPKPDPEGEGKILARLVLVRDELDVWNCVEERTWAYVEDGKLPETFQDGHKVPVRFHRELAAVGCLVGS